MATERLIIYVDDDADDVFLMEEAFSELGDIHLMSFPNGEELLHYLERAVCFPGLIILDINMPVLNGRETLRALKQHPIWSGIPTVLFSTGNQASERLFAAALNTELFVKPCDYPSLRRTVSRLASYVQTA